MRQPTLVVAGKEDLLVDPRDLEEAAKRHKFGVLHVHDLQQKMREKGVEYGGECAIFEVCNPHQAKKVLEREMAVATSLPCRIAVYEEGGRTKIGTILPTAMPNAVDGAIISRIFQTGNAFFFMNQNATKNARIKPP